MALPALLVIIALVVVGTVLFQHTLTEYLLPSKRHTAFANLERRRLESLTSWELRTVDAIDRLHRANDAFIQEASRQGS